MIGVPDEWPSATLMAVLSPSERLALVRLGTALRFRHREILMLEGDKGDEVYLLLAGFVKITAVVENGLGATLAIRPAGELVGEFAVLDGKPRAATVTACGPVDATRIGRERFLEFLGAHPQVAMEVTRSVVRKLRSATTRRVDERTLGAVAKLARVLHELAADYGRRHADGVRIELALTQVELGALAGVADSTAEAILSRWRREGVISTGYRRITVRNGSALESFAEFGEKP